MDYLIAGFSAIFVCYYLINSFLVVAGALSVRKEELAPVTTDPNSFPQLSIVVPAYNEEKDIVRTVQTLLQQNYPKFEIIVVNDGSKDATLSKLLSSFDLKPSPLAYKPVLATKSVAALYRNPAFPKLTVVDKGNGGKSDALNTGLNLATGSEFICVIDADVTLEKNALFHAVQPIVGQAQDNVIATGGNIRIGIGSEVSDGVVHSLATPPNLLILLQILEYVRSFSLFRLGWNSTNAVPLLSGAFGVFKREEILRSGGYQKFSKGEDMEITLRLHERSLIKKRPYRILQLTKPLCFTGAPATLKELAGQRIRWQVGLLSGLKVYQHMIFRPQYGALGTITLPYLLVFEAISPFLELAGYAILVASFFGLHQTPMAMNWFLASVIGGALFVNTISILAEASLIRLYTSPSDLFKLLCVGVLEPFGYHQLNQYWKIKAVYQFYRNIHLKSTWQPPKRN